MTAQESAIRHGSKIGRFVVVAELGSGGMGVVYAAHDRELDRQVALKVMRGAGEDEYEDRMRMLREGQAMARVTHPNVITVFEVGTEGGTVFLAQELLDGGSLGTWLEQPHALSEILDKFIAAGRGLAAAHAAGLVHRDFKPDNVLLGKDGRVRVSDFGLARALGVSTQDLAGPTSRGGGPPRDDVDVTRSPMSQLTRTGAVMGTPMFMAPEQHQGERADERSDQFAFCVALYHAVYGDWPFAGKTAIALADNVINGVMQEPPKGKKVPPKLRKLLLRGLSIDATARYPSMDALLADLVALREPPKSRAWLVVGALVFAAGAAGAAYMVLAKEPDKTAAVVDQPKPRKVDLPVDDGTTLVEALDSGRVLTIAKQYERDANLAGDGARAAIAEAGIAYTAALAGDLAKAEATLKAAEAKAGDDKRARAFVDMAAAAVRSAAGQPKVAIEHAHRCATTFAASEPARAAICYQLLGEASADIGNATDARAAFDKGLELARKLPGPELVSLVSLSIAQLEFDEKQEDVSLDDVTKHLTEARNRRAASSEANAAVLAARIRAIKGEFQAALHDLQTLNLDVLQVYRLRALARIAIGELYGLWGSGDDDGTGLDHIDRAIEDARKKGYWGVVLEGKLARVRVMLTLGEDGAEAARQALIAEANSRGYKRIARLAAAYIVEGKPAESPVEKPAESAPTPSPP